MKLKAVVAVIFMCLAVWICGFSAQKASQADYVPGEVLVRFNQDAGSTAINSFTAQYGLQSLDRIATINLYRMKAPSSADVFELSAQLSKDSRVVYAEPNFIDQILGETIALPNDTLYSQQWHYRLINMPAAWNKTTGSSSIVVAVVDTGVRFDHPDVGARFSANGYDFIDLDANPTDPDNGHGTHVSGTIGAITNNSLGVAGMTWTGPILPIRTLGTGGGTQFQFAQGFRYAAGLLSAPDPVNPTPAKVINYSGGGADGLTKKQAVFDVNAAGVIMVCAAGNENGAISYPAGYSLEYQMVICVGATNYGNGAPVKASYSNFGAAMNVVAPGGQTSQDSDGDGYPDGVLSTAWNFTSGTPTYEYWQGTSMATPHVTGLAALMLAKGILPSSVRTVMQNTATDLGTAEFDTSYGYGLINASAALDAGPALLMTPNQIAYATGNNLGLQVFRLVNPLSDPKLVELKVWLAVPGIGPISILNLGADMSFVIPGGFLADLGPVTLFSITAQWPRGTYEINSRMVDPVTGKFISEDINQFPVN